MKPYQNPLFVVTYNSWTKYINKRLTKHLESNFAEQENSASFLILRQPNEEFQIKRDYDLFATDINQKINENKNDIVVLVYPTSTTISVPGAAIVKASYRVIGFDIKQNKEIWNAEIYAKNHANMNVRTKKIAVILQQQLIENGILKSNSVAD